MKTIKQQVWEVLQSRPAFGVTMSEAVDRLPADINTHSISGALAAFVGEGLAVKRDQKRASDARGHLETVYRPAPGAEYVPKRGPNKRNRSVPRVSAIVREPSSAQVGDRDDWREGYRDGFAGRASLMDDYAAGYAQGVADRAAAG